MRHELLILGLICAGCATQPIVTTIVQPDVAVAIPETQPLTLNPVQWQVMSLLQLKKLVASIETSSQKDVILFSLDTTNYNNFSLNLIEIERYISEQKAILTMLKKIITERSAAGGNVTP